MTGGKPALLSRYHTSPLKIAKAFTLRSGERPQLAVVQMDVSPGMLEGDRYSFDWRLEHGVRLYATNQSYTRVHPCGAGASRLEMKFDLRRGAVLEWLPEPVMLFRGARFFSETEIDLAEGATCVLSDIFCPGRLSRGEAFAFGLYDSKVAVRYDGELIHYQRQRWEPDRLPLANAGCFGEYTHFGAFSVFSDRVTAELADRIRERLNRSEGLPAPGEGDVAGFSGPPRAEGLAWGVARTAKHGLVVQAAGHAAWRLQKLFLAAWDAVREEALGMPPLRLLKEAWMGTDA